MDFEVAQFAHDYLKSAAKIPNLKQFYSVPELKKIAIRHFIIYRNASPNPNHTRLGDLPETFDAAISDSISVEPLSPEDLTESKELLRRTNSRRIRKRLQSNPSIQTLGNKRGAVYGHISARPILNDEEISKIIEDILEHNPEPHRWYDLFSPTFQVIQEIHEQGAEAAKTDPNLIYDPYDIHDSSRTEFEQKIISKFNVKIPNKPDYKISKNSWYCAIWPANNDLKEWIEFNYSKEWFNQSSSNIQRILKESKRIITGTGINGNGIKRGLWVFANEEISDLTLHREHWKFRDQIRANFEQLMSNTRLELEPHREWLNLTRMHLLDLTDHIGYRLEDSSHLPDERKLRLELRKAIKTLAKSQPTFKEIFDTYVASINETDQTQRETQQLRVEAAIRVMIADGEISPEIETTFPNKEVK